jgi:hypothetical protein
MLDFDTPEGRLEAFAAAMKAADVTMIPPTYQGEDPEPFCNDVAEVVAKARAGRTI